jgi:5-formyltetrahydrofolate cyclo-ligase
MEMLRLYSSADLAACPLDKWGILDPGTHRRDIVEQVREDGGLWEVYTTVRLTPQAMDPAAPELDVILVPGVAFDAECNRVGLCFVDQQPPHRGKCNCTPSCHIWQTASLTIKLGRGKAFYDTFLDKYTSARTRPLLGESPP